MWSIMIIEVMCLAVIGDSILVKIFNNKNKLKVRSKNEKKNIKLTALLTLLVISLTGCVKFNSTMEIKKDKSMDYKIIYAFDKSLFGDQEILTSNDKKELENKGFTVSNYVDGNMKGFKVSKNIKNIDDVSSTNDATYDLSGLLDTLIHCIINACIFFTNDIKIDSFLIK